MITFLVIYVLSAFALIGVMYNNVKRMDLQPTFRQSVGHLLVILTPFLNTAVIAMVAGYMVNRYVRLWKIRRNNNFEF